MYRLDHVARLEIQLRQDEAIARARQARLVRDARPQPAPVRTRPIRRAVHRLRAV